MNGKMGSCWASDVPVEISKPEILPFERKGFTVVEWGGSEVGGGVESSAMGGAASARSAYSA